LESSIAVRSSFGAKQITAGSASMQQSQERPKIWWFLVQAAIVAVLFVLFAWAAWKSYSGGGDIGAWIMITVLIPAAIICEGLGLGKLSFIGPSSIPEPALWCAMIFVAYIYGLMLVGIVRAMVWGIKKRFHMRAARTPEK
jgi:hypothetical protein